MADARVGPESALSLLSPRVLIIDGDPKTRKLMSIVLRSSGVRVLDAERWLDGVELARERQPEAILLDPDTCPVPSVDPFAGIRAVCDAPVLVVAHSDRERDKVRALEAGAEDYVTKPFGSAELVARVRVILRRAAYPGRSAAEHVIQVGDLRLDLAHRLVLAGGAPVHLTPLEYKLFTTLMKNAGQVVTHDRLVRDVWGPERGDQAGYLRVYVSQLRQKLEREPGRPRYLMTEPLVGYRIRTEA